jgi:hypothetical protein
LLLLTADRRALAQRDSESAFRCLCLFLWPPAVGCLGSLWLKGGGGRPPRRAMAAVDAVAAARRSAFCKNGANGSARLYWLAEQHGDEGVGGWRSKTFCEAASEDRRGANSNNINSKKETGEGDVSCREPNWLCPAPGKRGGQANDKQNTSSFQSSHTFCHTHAMWTARRVMLVFIAGHPKGENPVGGWCLSLLWMMICGETDNRRKDIRWDGTWGDGGVSIWKRI